MTHVTHRLTAKNRDQVRNPTLGNRVWASFTFFCVLRSYVYYFVVATHFISLSGNSSPQTDALTGYDTIRYDTRSYFNVRSKADVSRLDLPHGTNNYWPVGRKRNGWGCFFCKKSGPFLNAVSVFFLFYILLRPIWGVRTHPTHPPPLPTGLN